MSDFLSNFTNNNYTDPEKKPSQETSKHEPKEEIEPPIRKPAAEKRPAPAEAPRQSQKKAPPPVVESTGEHEVEIDPTYKKRRQRKLLLFSITGVLLVAVLFFAYYQFSHVAVPDFLKQEIAEAREWAVEEGVVLKTNSSFDFDTEVNQVTKQSIKAGDKIKKGKTLTLTVSLGPDPDEQLDLPDFKSLSLTEARDWIEANKAENLSLIEQYDNKVEKGGFVKQEFADKELTAKNYKRKDRMMVYYSKGKETFEKNIDVPDFKNKTLTDVTEWAKTNDIKLVTEKVFSQSVNAEGVISQGTAAGAKIAKQDSFTIRVSKGKALVVPDYKNYTLEQAQELSTKLSAVIKSVYSETVPYGRFISQNVTPGTEFDENGEPPTVEVIYSEGRPYLKDLRNSMMEGDLPKLFFETYAAKGASITYDVYYVDSSKPKGTVIEMSRYGEYVPMNAHLTFGISLGNIQSDSGEEEIPEPMMEEEDEEA
ncbi:hypothetical protein NRIC_34710 [Enterococcus florum]|uniref:PASTA domain-containing protein n=1 Tax=Enterococcus florum TaxID=2480627 RepID=A0A4P5PBZ3_9ENTE|nr:PASTA domain-containing protein [Enterococcus florum]GCF95580.1 hypothetical protein NRIC_34710 [Enterococcus florum]